MLQGRRAGNAGAAAPARIRASSVAMTADVPKRRPSRGHGHRDAGEALGPADRARPRWSPAAGSSSIPGTGPRSALPFSRVAVVVGDLDPRSSPTPTTPRWSGLGSRFSKGSTRPTGRLRHGRRDRSRRPSENGMTTPLSLRAYRLVTALGDAARRPASCRMRLRRGKEDARRIEERRGTRWDLSRPRERSSGCTARASARPFRCCPSSSASRARARPRS